MDKLKFWFIAARGYSLPMSIISWLIIAVFALKSAGNLFYGIAALIGIAFAHLGANLFDDFIDFKSQTPKQECKSRYLQDRQTSLKSVGIAAFVCFGVAAATGVFFVIKFGVIPLILAGVAGILCLLYPKINDLGLGEIVVGILFAPILFSGVYFVMTNSFSVDVLFLSIPVMLFTVVLLDAHAYMDYDTDILCNKKTLCVIAGSKKNALYALNTLIFAGYVSILALILVKILSLYGVLCFLTVPLALRLSRSLTIYAGGADFMRNFIMARNLAIFTEILIVLGILL